VTTQSGLKYEDIRVGGPPAKIGDTLEVHYTGWLKDGKKFVSSEDAGQPSKGPLVPNRIIKGCFEGLQGMRVGGIRKLIIPSHLAYGPRGDGKGRVPPNAELTFEFELLKLEGKK
jgi:FKBP-type peptidyl-prolyl cis-trans isomerase